MSGRQFKVIPVLDVRFGRAVRAVAGDRASYRPLETPLAAGTSDPVEVARGYRRLFPFNTLYVADLDGIEGRGTDHAMQLRVATAWSGGEVWSDDGAISPGLDPVAGGAAITRVIGSETLADVQALTASPPHILSLDFRGDTFLGPAPLLEDAGLWPERLIVMTLARVGGGEGPDLERLLEIMRRAGPGRLIYAAGGVRNRYDLDMLKRAGCAGALVATALHGGQIKTGDLEEIAGES